MRIRKAFRSELSCLVKTPQSDLKKLQQLSVAVIEFADIRIVM